jgi:hypothetical protein
MGKAGQSNSPNPRKRPSLVAALKQAKKAGHDVRSVAVYGDHIELRFDEHALGLTAVTPLEAWRAKKNACQT